MTGFGGPGDVPGKQLELFSEVVPRLRRVLILLDPEDPVAMRRLTEVRATAKSLKLLLVERQATTQADLERVFGSLKPGGVNGVFIVSPTFGPNFHLSFSVWLLRSACL